MLHVRCGDDILEKLPAGGVPGTVLRWMDPLCEGPAPSGLDADGFRAVRAAWTAARYGIDPATAARTLRDQDAALEAGAARADETVLWFEHDLFDQTIMIHLLDRLWPLAGDRLSLICLDRHPDVARFVGLGQLTPAHLAALLPRRRRVTQAQAALAGRAWAAFTAPTPEPLNDVTAELAGQGDQSPLPFLRAALDRHRRQYPWCRHGLSQTEWLLLKAVAAGADSPAAAARFVMAQEPAPWQGDAMIVVWLKELAEGRQPVVTANEGGPLTLTAAGRAVLDGERRAEIGSRWLGGVHLAADRPSWCWDAKVRRVVPHTNGPRY